MARMMNPKSHLIETYSPELGVWQFRCVLCSREENSAVVLVAGDCVYRSKVFTVYVPEYDELRGK